MTSMTGFMALPSRHRPSPFPVQLDKNPQLCPSSFNNSPKTLSLSQLVMGDSALILEKVRTELEELYLGIPDDSVNLSFHDLADVTT